MQPRELLDAPDGDYFYQWLKNLNSPIADCPIDIFTYHPRSGAVDSSASVCGRRAGKVERRRSDGGNEVGAQRRRRAADGSPSLVRLLQRMQLVTIARFVKRNGRGRGGDGVDQQPVQRSNARDGHAVKCGVREILESGRET